MEDTGNASAPTTGSSTVTSKPRSLPQAPQGRRVPEASPTETVVVTDQQFLHREALAQHLSTNCTASSAASAGVNGKHGDIRHARLHDDLELLFERREQRRRGRRIDDLQRMRLERHDDAWTGRGAARATSLASTS